MLFIMRTTGTQIYSHAFIVQLTVYFGIDRPGRGAASKERERWPESVEWRPTMTTKAANRTVRIARYESISRANIGNQANSVIRSFRSALCACSMRPILLRYRRDSRARHATNWLSCYVWLGPPESDTLSSGMFVGSIMVALVRTGVFFVVARMTAIAGFECVHAHSDYEKPVIFLLPCCRCCLPNRQFASVSWIHESTHGPNGPHFDCCYFYHRTHHIFMPV